MKLYTIQLAKRKRAEERGIPLLDITVKTGKGSGFEPSWDMVLSHKSDYLSDEDYTERYKARMRLSYMFHRDKWLAVLAMPQVALACYCAPGRFCHRHLLKDILKIVAKLNDVPFEDMGEL